MFDRKPWWRREPHRAFFGCEKNLIGGGFHLAEAASVQSTLPFRARSEDTILEDAECVEHGPRQRAFFHIIERALFDHPERGFPTRPRRERQPLLARSAATHGRSGSGRSAWPSRSCRHGAPPFRRQWYNRL